MLLFFISNVKQKFLLINLRLSMDLKAPSGILQCVDNGMMTFFNVYQSAQVVS